MAKTERTLSASQLAIALGVHVNTVKHHARKGLPCSEDRRGVRRFNEKECRRWLATQGSVHYNGGNKVGAYARKSTKPNSKAKAEPAEDPDEKDPNSPLQIELRLKLAKIEEIETKTAERKGVLVNAHDVQEVVTTHLLSARVAFEAVPVKAAAKVLSAIEADSQLHHKIATAIKEEIDQAMQSLSEVRL